MRNHWDISSYWDSVTRLFLMRLFSVTNPIELLSMEKDSNKATQSVSCMINSDTY